MPERYVNVDRDTPLLLPPDLRDWVAHDDFAPFILEAVGLCELSAMRRNVRGSGSAQYPPTMMLALLIYCYAHQTFSSRRIERATFDSVSVRYLCANHHPDHDTIAEFRRQNHGLLQHCLGQVLQLARRTGVLKLGAISLDGTRLAGAGSARSVCTLEQIEAELREFETLGAELLEQAERADQREAADGTRLPAELADRERQQQKLRAAQAQIEARRAQARREQRQDGPGSFHQTAHASVSEPESRRLRRGAAEGTVQGYNAQAAVDAGESGLIVGAHLSDEPADNRLLAAGLAAVRPEAGSFSVVLVDKGYESSELTAQAEAAHRVVVLSPARQAPPAVPKTQKRSARKQAVVDFRRRMAARLEGPGYQQLYRRRRVTVEPVFARIKANLGFRRFRCWGRQGASAEWSLICLVHNLCVLRRKRQK